MQLHVEMREYFLTLTLTMIPALLFKNKERYLTVRTVNQGDDKQLLIHHRY